MFLRKVFNVTKKASESERLEESSDESISNMKSAQPRVQGLGKQPQFINNPMPVSTHVDYATRGMLGFHRVIGTFTRASDAEMMASEWLRTGRLEVVQKTFKPKQQINGYLTCSRLLDNIACTAGRTNVGHFTRILWSKLPYRACITSA